KKVAEMTNVILTRLGAQRREAEDLRLTHATCGAAKSGAATSAVAPRRRGYELAGSGTIGVAAASDVSARAAMTSRMTGPTWSHASVISPPTKICAGFNVLTITARPPPRWRAVSSSAARARTSPSRERDTTSVIVNPDSIR